MRFDMRFSERIGPTDTPRLPLSWRYAPNLSAPTAQSLYLPISHTTWVREGNVPAGWSLPQLWTHYREQHNSGLVMLGLSPDGVRELQREGAFYLVSGLEAVLPLHHNPLAKASLRELVKRGLRHGRVTELPLTPEYQQQLEHFWAHTPHAGPRLKHLFRTDPAAMDRLFVLQRLDTAPISAPDNAQPNAWLAAATLSRLGLTDWHLELMLRRSDAPIGVVEALFMAIHQTLAQEGHRYFSLGEVPFKGPVRDWRTWTLFRVGRSIKFAYNAEGLFQFKAKFQPVWRPVVLATDAPPSLALLTDLFFKTNCHRMVWHALKKQVRRAL